MRKTKKKTTSSKAVSKPVARLYAGLPLLLFQDRIKNVFCPVIDGWSYCETKDFKARWLSGGTGYEGFQTLTDEEWDALMAERTQPPPKTNGVLHLPLILGPLVTPLMCQREGLPVPVKASCPKCGAVRRNSVVDPEDGREWVVQDLGGVIVADKGGNSEQGLQVFGQYERLRSSTAASEHRAKAFKRAFEESKKDDHPALTEASKAEVERILKAAKDARKLFEDFEQGHPECLRKRLVGEAGHHRTQVARLQAEKAKYEKAVEDWQSKLDEAKAAQGEAFKDDQLAESKQVAMDALAATQAKLAAEEETLSGIEGRYQAIPELAVEQFRYEIAKGQTVSFS